MRPVLVLVHLRFLYLPNSHSKRCWRHFSDSFEGVFCEVRTFSEVYVLSGRCTALRPGPAVQCTGRHRGLVTHPGAQADGLNLPFPELRLRDALRPVGRTVAPEQPNRPGDPVSRDLLLREVHADIPR
jgi:hypothetical protein